MCVCARASETRLVVLLGTELGVGVLVHHVALLGLEVGVLHLKDPPLVLGALVDDGGTVPTIAQL